MVLLVLLMVDGAETGRVTGELVLLAASLGQQRVFRCSGLSEFLAGLSRRFRGGENHFPEALR